MTEIIPGLDALFESPYFIPICAILFIITVSYSLTAILKKSICKSPKPNRHKLTKLKTLERLTPLLPLFISLFVAVYFTAKDLLSLGEWGASQIIIKYIENVLIYAGVSSYIFKVFKTTIFNK